MLFMDITAEHGSCSPAVLIVLMGKKDAVGRAKKGQGMFCLNETAWEPRKLSEGLQITELSEDFASDSLTVLWVA